MNGIEWFAYVILPLSTLAVGWIVALAIDRNARRP